MGKDLQYINPAAVRMPSGASTRATNGRSTRKLTLNYGLRYEYYPFATRDHRGGERYDPVTRQGAGRRRGIGSADNAGVDVGKGSSRRASAWHTA